jgi:hypothetical protein
MKKVKVTIEGTLLMCEYCSKSLIEEDGDFYSEYYAVNGWDKLDALYINDDESENLIKKKGKYVKVYDYFHELFSEDGDHPLPVEMHTRTSYGNDKLSYEIDLEYDEDFDIKKLQLIKSDYEIECCPYFVVAEKILYNGKECFLTDESQDDYSDYGIEGRYCDEYTIDKFYNG